MMGFLCCLSRLPASLSPSLSTVSISSCLSCLSDGLSGSVSVSLSLSAVCLSLCSGLTAAAVLSAATEPAHWHSRGVTRTSKTWYARRTPTHTHTPAHTHDWLTHTLTWLTSGAVWLLIFNWSLLFNLAVDLESHFKCGNWLPWGHRAQRGVVAAGPAWRQSLTRYSDSSPQPLCLRKFVRSCVRLRVEVDVLGCPS